jgi:hypothetical protein
MQNFAVPLTLDAGGTSLWGVVMPSFVKVVWAAGGAARAEGPAAAAGVSGG